LLILCSVIWGFSYYFIKHALMAFAPMQVASIRAVSAGIVLLPLAYTAFRKIPVTSWGYVALCALIGNGIPMYLYPLAQTHISSAITGIVNSMTPLCTYFIAVAFFGMKNTVMKIAGVLTGLAGAVGLIFFRSDPHGGANLFYLGVAFIAPVMYGLNANLLKKYLMQFPALPLTVLMYFFLLIPAVWMLFETGAPERVRHEPLAVPALIHALMLGILGTAVAMTLFNVLIRRADIMFAASISYMMPVVAVCTGILDGETLGVQEIWALILILAGVLMINLRQKEQRQNEKAA
jgi:drug/metabolite transporter (DMT)-like permease